MAFPRAAINEAIAAVIPEREALVTSRRRFTWREFQLRSRRLANVLIANGLGCHRERNDRNRGSQARITSGSTSTTATSISRE